MNNKTEKNLFLVLLIIAGIIGTYIGYLTTNKYAILQRGILSGTILVLFYIIFFRSKELANILNKPIEIQKIIVYAPIVIFLSVLVYWAIDDLSLLINF